MPLNSYLLSPLPMETSTSASNMSHSDLKPSAPTPKNACLINDENSLIIFAVVVAFLFLVIATLTAVIIYLHRKGKRFRPGDIEPGETIKEQQIEEFAPLTANVNENETLVCETKRHYVANKTELYECELYRLFRKLIEVLGSAGCVKLLLNIDPNGNFTNILTNSSFENFYQCLVDWASKNPNIPHGEVIKQKLTKIGYRLPPDSEPYGVGAENHDDEVTISKLLVSLTKACVLNAEFRQFCLRLAGKLSVTQMWRVAEELNLRTEMDHKSHCGDLDASFAETLVEWGLCSPFTQRDGSEWDKLMVFKGSIVEVCGETAVPLFEETAASLIDILKTYN